MLSLAAAGTVYLTADNLEETRARSRDSAGLLGSGGAAIGEAEKEDLVLQDTFAQETAVTIEDPNMN